LERLWRKNEQGQEKLAGDRREQMTNKVETYKEKPNKKPSCKWCHLDYRIWEN